MSEIISLILNICITRILSKNYIHFCCIGIYFDLRNIEEWSQYFSIFQRKSMYSSELRPTDEIEYRGFDAVIEVMRGESIFCSMFFCYVGKELVPIGSCGVFNTHFLIFREFRDIEFFGFT